MSNNFTLIENFLLPLFMLGSLLMLLFRNVSR